MTSGVDEEARYREVRGLDPASPETLGAMVRGLYDESWRVRRAAAEQLAARTDDAATLDRLLGALADAGQTGARNAAAEALVRMGRRALEAVVGLLRHDDPDQRKFAAEILGQLRIPEAVPALVAAISDRDLNARVAVVESLGQLGGEEAARAVEPLLGSGPGLLQLAVLEALARMRRPPPLQVLAPMLEEPQLRRSAYRLLGLVQHPAAVSMLARGLAEATLSVREAAVSGIGLQALASGDGSRGALEATLRAETRRAKDLRDLLATLFDSEGREVRVGALVVCAALGEVDLATVIAEVARDDSLFEEVVRTLERLGPAAARELLAHLFELSAPARAAAVDALIHAADPALVPTLEEAAASGDSELQQLAIQSLAKAQTPDAVAPLIAMLGNPALARPAGRALVSVGQALRTDVAEALLRELERRTTPAAISALAAVQPVKLAPLLPRLVRDADAEVRTAAFTGVGAIGVEDCLELCRIGLGDEAASVRIAATSALARCADARAEALLRHALSDEELSVRAAAVDAAGERGGPSLAPELERVAKGREGLLAVGALRALARLGAIRPQVLEEAAKHPDPEVLKQALEAGASLREGVALALRSLRHPRWDVRVAAAQALAGAGDAECRAAVEQALVGDSDALVREALHRALEKLASR